MGGTSEREFVEKIRKVKEKSSKTAMRSGRKKFLILFGVFLLTLPISMMINMFRPFLTIIQRFFLSVFGMPIPYYYHYYSPFADAAWHFSYILTSLFFTFLAWLLMRFRENTASLKESQANNKDRLFKCAL